MPSVVRVEDVRVGIRRDVDRGHPGSVAEDGTDGSSEDWHFAEVAQTVGNPGYMGEGVADLVGGLDPEELGQSAADFGTGGRAVVNEEAEAQELSSGEIRSGRGSERVPEGLHGGVEGKDEVIFTVGNENEVVV